MYNLRVVFHDQHAGSRELSRPRARGVAGLEPLLSAIGPGRLWKGAWLVGLDAEEWFTGKDAAVDPMSGDYWVAGSRTRCVLRAYYA